jgi:multicomponent K+:H+ antiporter subunit D
VTAGTGGHGGERRGEQRFVGALPLVASGLLLSGLVALTVFAGPVSAWLDETAAQVHDSGQYVDAVLGAGGENE